MQSADNNLQDRPVPSTLPQSTDHCVKVACHLEAPCNVCNIKHPQVPQQALVLQSRHLTAQVLQTAGDDNGTWRGSGKSSI